MRPHQRKLLASRLAGVVERNESRRQQREFARNRRKILAAIRKREFHTLNDVRDLFRSYRVQYTIVEGFGVLVLRANTFPNLAFLCKSEEYIGKEFSRHATRQAVPPEQQELF